jgi:hypothetical protein
MIERDAPVPTAPHHVDSGQRVSSELGSNAFPGRLAWPVRLCGGNLHEHRGPI